MYQILNRALLNLEDLSDMVRNNEDVKFTARLVKENLKFSNLVQKYLKNNVHKHRNKNRNVSKVINARLGMVYLHSENSTLR